MTASGTASNGTGPRYAPEDPTLPKPWKGLVDGSTGYLYYWNPVSNVTQYERPVSEELPPPPPLPPKLAPLSSVQVHHHHDEDGRSRSHQHQSGRAGGARSGHGSVDVGHGSSGAHSHLHGVHPRTSSRNHGSLEAGASLSAEAYRRQHEVTVTGDDVPTPYMTFESTGFPPEILKEVHRAGFSSPTPIQAQSWPIALQSRDVVAIAKTGSGKTLGYLLPGFIHLKRLHKNSKMGPTVLVLSPTRELATQIQDEAEKFGRSSRISCTCLYGGAPKGPQLRDVDRGVDVVVATPGRLNDILEMKRVSLRQVSYLVLDEADRMLDMGFEPQIRKIVKEVPHRRQTLMFTATWPKEVRKIAADLLVNPIQVNIGNIDELVANKSITQYVEIIKPIEKQRRLEQILRSQETGSKILVFCSTKRMCDQLSKSLARQFGAAAIHGDKSQGERDRVLSQFKTGRSPILVATDVAARGLDIKDIKVVINYDFPTGVEDYVHRIGRTGRAGATGISYTFFSDQDSKYALDLVKVLEGADQHVPPELHNMVARGGYGGKSRRWRSGSGAREKNSFGFGRGDSTNAGRSGHALSLISRIDGNHDRNGYGRDRESRDRHDRGHMDGRDTNKRSRNDAKGILRGRSRSRSSSPSLKRGRNVLGIGRSRSRSRSWDNVHSRSRSRSRSLGRSNGRLDVAGPSSRPSPTFKRKETSVDHHHGGQSPPFKRKETSVDHHHGGQSPPPKRRETSNDRHHGSSSLTKREVSIDRHRGPSPQYKRETLIDVHLRASPQQTPADDRYRTSYPNNEPLIAQDHACDAHRPLSHDRSPDPPRQRSPSPKRQTENESRGNLASPGQMRQSPLHYLGETEPDMPKTPKHEGGIESGELPNGLAQSAPDLYNGEEEEEGLIHPDEEEGMIPPEPVAATPEHVPNSRDN